MKLFLKLIELSDIADDHDMKTCHNPNRNNKSSRSFSNSIIFY